MTNDTLKSHPSSIIALQKAAMSFINHQESLLIGSASGIQMHRGTVPAQDPNVFNKCSHCATESSTLHRCSRCKFVAYCGRECQAKDWDFHKELCKKSTKSGSSPNIGIYREIDNWQRAKISNKALVEKNRGVIVEVLNCANFLSAVQNVLGKDGPAVLDFEIRGDVQSANAQNIPDMTVNVNISKSILGKSIGKKGEVVTMDHVLQMLERLAADRGDRCNDFELDYVIDLVKAVKSMIGRRGPLYFEHGVVRICNDDCRVSHVDRFKDNIIDIDSHLTIDIH